MYFGCSLTMPPYGIAFKNFLESSGVPEYQLLAERLDFAPTIKEGLELARHHG